LKINKSEKSEIKQIRIQINSAFGIPQSAFKKFRIRHGAIRIQTNPHDGMAPILLTLSSLRLTSLSSLRGKRERISLNPKSHIRNPK